MFSWQSPVEVWGGLECTINRVDDIFFDQLAMSGHRQRVDHDLELFANLGLRTLRTPVLWEQFAKDNSWAYADRCLRACLRLGIDPVVGLVHHGSGPPTTNLLDPEFPEKLAAYGLEVAQRYPWVTDYTPVNEPQTTARFACLYGHWYPHHRSMRSHLRALINQLKGIVLAMEAIRSIQPEARLIHTEDGGTTQSTRRLESFRIEREHRRWIGLDLLCGRVNREHPLFLFLLTHGLSEKEIFWFAERPCPPSIIGLNYYVTSDRFLDDRIELYPPYLCGGDSGDEPLVDVEAVRVSPKGIAGAKTILCQAWDRYHLPVAITEAHLGCDSDQQMRWLAEIWQHAHEAYCLGVDVRSVTAWGLLGLFNWSNLCTRDTGAYEPGVYDVVSSRSPLETPLADFIKRMIKKEPLPRVALSPESWWHHSSRILIAPDTGDLTHQSMG